MTDAETSQKQYFYKLKSIGDQLLELPTPLTRDKSKVASLLLKDLLLELQSIQEPELVMSIPTTQSVIIPLISTFKSMKTEEQQGYEIVIEPWLKIMHFLLSKTLVKTWMPQQFTIQLIILFTNLINQLDTHSKANFSEEIRYEAVLCLSSGLPAEYKEGRYTSFDQSIYYPLTQKLRNSEFVKIASPCVVALLDVMKKEQNITLRLEAIRTLSQLLLDNIYNVDDLAILLPGIVSKLCSTLSQKGEKENHQMVCSMLEVLGEFIEYVMRDELNTTLKEVYSFQDIITQHQEPVKDTDAQVLRTEAWYKKTKESLANVMGQILKIRHYPDWRARLAFVEFAYRLLSTCGRTLDNCTKPLIEMIVLHTDDTYREVSDTCAVRMRTLSSTRAFEESIKPILKDELYQWMMNFPKYMISRDETEKTNAMALIAGYILLLGDASESVLSIVLGRASDGWMTALEIDKDSLNILEEKQHEKFIELNTNEETRSTPLYPRIRFKHVVTDVTTAKLTRMLNVIGTYCDLQTWIHHFFRYLSVDNVESNDPQAAYIIHSLLSGAFALRVDTEVEDWANDTNTSSGSDGEKLKRIALNVLKETMDILTFAASYKGRSTALISTSSAFDLDEESGHILTVCFGLQLVGLTSYILDHDTVQDQLITILYPLLAHLGSTNVYIHTYALITLDAIALTCGLSSAKDLAIQNIDYIINMISQHISVLSENPRVPMVLKALIHVGGHTSISYLEDTVLEIYDALDRYSMVEWLCIQLCGVLFEIIQTMERKSVKPSQSPSKEHTSPEDNSGISLEIKAFIQDNQDDEDNINPEHKSMEAIGQYFLDRQAEGKHEDLTLQSIMEQGNLPMDLPKENDADESPEDQEVKIPLNKEEQMAKDIMDKSSLFLTDASPQLRSQMLVLLTSGVSVLSNHPQEVNQLIFSFWGSIVHRLDDPQNYVVLQAASLVEKIAEVSTDYISRKFEDDLWPRFKSLLRKGTTAAVSNKSTDYSKFSLYHRTQLCLMKTLTHIAKHVPMNQRKIKEILEETKYYYRNDLVHPQLTEQCSLLFDALSTQQPDTVWFFQAFLDRSSYSHLHSPPSLLLKPFVIPEWLERQDIPTVKNIYTLL